MVPGVVGAPHRSWGYNPALDGLRTVAVVGVVIFHLDHDWLPGGFVGVDVFFVLSGYLMMAVVRSDMERDRYSATSFLVRRVRRLLPALAVVVAASLLLASVVMLPVAFTSASESALFALLSVSNIYFWRVNDYFAPIMDQQLFLHTWSLGVEAQFYVSLALGLALLGLVGMRKPGPRVLVPLVGTVVAVSLAANIYLVDVRGMVTGSFYLPVTRLWELLLGSLLALLPIRRYLTPPQADLLGFTGLIAIVVPMVLLEGTDPFPGANALPPVLGTALVIAGCQREGVIHRALALPPMVGLGLVSYSVYLWHWPLIVLWSYGTLRDIGPLDAILLSAFTLGLSVLTYRFVEVPCRSARPPAMRRTVMTGGLATVCIALALVVETVRETGLVREHGELLAYVGPDYEAKVSASYGFGTCFVFVEPARTVATECLAVGSDVRPSIMIFGDSHAAHLRPGFEAMFPNARILQATVAGCRPFLNHSSAPGPACDGTRAMAFDFLNRERPDLVVLAGRWMDTELPNLALTLDLLKANDQRVVVVGPSVEYNAELPSLLLRAGKKPERVESARLEDRFTLDALMRPLVEERGFTYASSIAAICDGRSCDTTTADGVPIQWDYGHLTREGSVEVISRIFTALDPEGRLGGAEPLDVRDAEERAPNA